MKRRTFLVCTAALFCGALLAGGCTQKTSQPVLQQIEYANLADSDTQALLSKLLQDAGVSDLRIQTFFDHVQKLGKKSLCVRICQIGVFNLLKDGLRSFLSAASCQKCTAKKCSGADKKSSTFQKWSPRCVFRKVSLSAGVSTIGEESNGGGLVTNGITDKQRKSMTSVVFDPI